MRRLDLGERGGGAGGFVAVVWVDDGVCEGAYIYEG